MIVLDTSGKSLSVSLDGAVTTNQLQCVCSYKQIVLKYSGQQGSQNSYVPFTIENVFHVESDTVTNDTSLVTLVVAPTASDAVWLYRHEIKTISIYNADTVDAVVNVWMNTVTDRIIVKVELPPMYHLHYEDSKGWYVLDTTGAIVSSITLLASSLQIGDAVTGGTANYFLYVDAGGLLANKSAASLYSDIQALVKDDVYSFLGPCVTSGNPADSTTYFAGLGALTFIVTDTAVDFSVGFNCTVIGMINEVSNNSTAGTNENWTSHVRKTSGGGSSSASFGNFQTNATTTNVLSFTLMGTTFDVDAADTICAEYRSPALATNPVGVQIRAWLIVKRR